MLSSEDLDNGTQRLMQLKVGTDNSIEVFIPDYYGNNNNYIQMSGLELEDGTGNIDLKLSVGSGLLTI